MRVMIEMLRRSNLKIIDTTEKRDKILILTSFRENFDCFSQSPVTSDEWSNVERSHYVRLHGPAKFFDFHLALPNFEYKTR